MREYLLFILIILCSFVNSHAQDLYKISGRVLDKDQKALEFAAAVLSDSQTKKLIGTTTSKDGSFTLNAKEGIYSFEVSLIGYQKYTTTLKVDKDINFEVIVLEEDISLLKEIKVTANRVEYNMSGYEYRVGNIEALKNKDLAEVLNTAPGVMVTNKVTLYGSPVINIYVDRRKIKMNEDALLAYLQSYKGANIEKIEVISNPDISARHSGTALKITTKKETGGFMSASARNSFNANNFVFGSSFNIDYRRDNIAFYGSGGYQFQKRDRKDVISYQYKSSDKNAEDIIKEKIKFPLSANGTFGIAYDITKNDYLSAEVSFREIDKDLKRKTTSEESGIVTSEKQIFYKTSDKKPAFSLMYTHKFKDASEITVTGDYVGSYKNNDITDDILAASHTENNSSTFAGYSNYQKRIKRKHTLNAGLRYSYIRNNSINNDLRFDYDESLLRPFTSYSVDLKKAGFRIGLTGDWASINHHDYFDLLPSVSLNYYIDRKKGNILSAGYSMAVHRPSISQLDPNAVLSEKDIIIREGNPSLKSYNSHVFKSSLKLLNSINLSATYNRANKAISAYLYTKDDETIYQTYTNNASFQEISAGAGYYKYLFNKLNLNLSVSYAYSESKIDGMTKRNNSISCALIAALSLPASFSLTAEAYAESKKRIGYNAYKKEPFILYLKVAKRINRWNLSFTVSDVFNSYKRGENMTIDLGNYTRRVTNKTESRSYNFMATYNFSWGRNGRAKKARTQKNEMNERIGD